jgi:hypothetical protein
MEKCYINCGSLSINTKFLVDEFDLIQIKLMSVNVNMSRPEVVLCAHDKPVVIDLAVISLLCPPVLVRLLDMSQSSDFAGRCFKEAPRDEQGRLTFAKHLGISRSNFQACITFIKTGYVGSIEVLVRTMDILGGSDKLDAYVAKKQAENEAQEAYRLEKELSERENPLTPAADIDNLYIWRAQQGSWMNGQSDEWSVTNRVGRNTVDYWWRKRRETVEEMDEEL